MSVASPLFTRSWRASTWVAEGMVYLWWIQVALWLSIHLESATRKKANIRLAQKRTGRRSSLGQAGIMTALASWFLPTHSPSITWARLHPSLSMGNG